MSGGMRRHRTGGFTLIELLIALAVFAVLSVVAYGGLQVALEARQRVEAQAARLAELQLAFTVIGRDLEQAVNRPVRDEFGDRMQAMTGAGAQIEFTRAGWRNPAGLQRSELQRVGYILTGSELRRLSWPILDRTQGTEPRDAVLLAGVEGFELRFLDGQGQWLAFWPAPLADPQATALPRAVEVSFETERWGRVTRLFRTVPGLPVLAPGAPQVPGT